MNTYDQEESLKTKIIGWASQEDQPIITMVHSSSELSQYMELLVDENQILSPIVQPPKAIAAWESFPKFVLSMENLVAILDTYDPLLRKISRNIVKKVRTVENIEE